jgi:hypothetical protein
MNNNDIIGQLAIRSETVWIHNIPLEQFESDEQLFMRLRCPICSSSKRNIIDIERCTLLRMGILK